MKYEQSTNKQNPYYQNNNTYEMNTYNNTSAGNPYGENPYGNSGQAYGNSGQAYGNSGQGYGNNGQAYGNNTGTGAAYGGGNDDIAFYNEISSINGLLDNYGALINQIQNTQRRVLNEVDEERQFQLGKDIDNLTAQASSQQNEIKSRLQAAFKTAGADASRKAQAETAKEHFLQQIQRYQSAESDYKARNQEQAERQYRIVNPSATQQEVQAAINDQGGQQIFSQTLLNSDMKGRAQSALSEVRARHREIQKIEQSMQELARLFDLVENLIIEQDAGVTAVHERVTTAREHIDEGVKETGVAIEKAKKARRKKCWCIWISIIIIIIIIAAIVGGIAGKFANNKK